MAEALLQTKLGIPPARSGLVPRQNLVERFNQGLHLVVALPLFPLRPAEVKRRWPGNG